MRQFAKAQKTRGTRAWRHVDARSRMYRIAGARRRGEAEEQRCLSVEAQKQISKYAQRRGRAEVRETRGDVRALRCGFSETRMLRGADI